MTKSTVRSCLIEFLLSHSPSFPKPGTANNFTYYGNLFLRRSIACDMIRGMGIIDIMKIDYSNKKSDEK